MATWGFAVEHNRTHRKSSRKTSGPETVVGAIWSSPEPHSRCEVQCAVRWLGLALGTLSFAGYFPLVAGRMPILGRLPTDPLFSNHGLGVMDADCLIAVVSGLFLLGIMVAIWRQGSERRIRTLKPITEAHRRYE